MRERMRNYELMLVINPLHADEDNIDAIVGRIQDTVEAGGGALDSVNYETPWGRRKLAYSIRAYAGGEASRRIFTEGFYMLFQFSLPSVQVAELERTIKFMDFVLRHLVILAENQTVGSSDDFADEEAFADEPEYDSDTADTNEEHAEEEEHEAEETESTA